MPELKITEFPESEFPYEVNLSASISETGKRLRKRFKTQGEAKGFIAAVKEKRSLGIQREILLPGHVKQQALRANDLLSARFPEVCLLDAVEAYADARVLLAAVGVTDIRLAATHYAEAMKAKADSVTFVEMMDRFRDAPTKKKGRKKSGQYQNQIDWLKSALTPALGDRLVCDIAPLDLEKAISESGIPDGSVDAAYRVARAAFNVGKKRGWLRDNPVDNLDWFSNEAEEARVPSLAQARALLACADDDILPYVAVGLFAGPRDSEIRRLTWECFNWEKSELTIPAAPGRKESVGRYVPLEANLVAWLRPLAKRGPLCPSDADGMQWKLKCLRKEADKALVAAKLTSEATLETEWQRNLLRHGAGSYWGAVHGIAKASAWLGHGEDVHKKHYRKPVPREQADAFFKILPESCDAKIISLSA